MADGRSATRRIGALLAIAVVTLSPQIVGHAEAAYKKVMCEVFTSTS